MDADSNPAELSSDSSLSLDAAFCMNLDDKDRVTPSSGQICRTTDLPKKSKRPFDLDRYCKRHIALRIAYLGWSFQGFASQQDTDNTVQGYLRRALLKTRLIADMRQAKFCCCGRTDKGVSAFAQVVTLCVRSALKSGSGIIPALRSDSEDVEVPKNECNKELDYCKMLNGNLPREIRILGWSPVSDDFSARFSCTTRVYRYFFLKGDLDLEPMQTAASLFVGEHDFRNFCKQDLVNVEHFVREIYSCTVHLVESSTPPAIGQVSLCPQLCFLEIAGSGFLWHQVRCIMAVLFLIGQRNEQPPVVEKLLDISACPGKPDYQMASELPLVLWDCSYSADALHFEYSPDVLQSVYTSFFSVFEYACYRYVLASAFLSGLDMLPVNITAIGSSIPEAIISSSSNIGSRSFGEVHQHSQSTKEKRKQLLELAETKAQLFQTPEHRRQNLSNGKRRRLKKKLKYIPEGDKTGLNNLEDSSAST